MLFVFAIFVFLLANIPDLGDVFIALATIVLACVAIFSFEESRRLRKQYKEQEERDRKEKVLKEIIDWTTEVIDFTAGQTALGSKDIMGVISSDMPFEIMVKAVAQEQHVKLNRLSSKSIYVDSMRTRLFPNNTDLRLAIHNVRRKIYEHLRYLELEMIGRVKNPGKAAQIHLRRLLQDALSLVEIAVDMYTEIK